MTRRVGRWIGLAGGLAIALSVTAGLLPAHARAVAHVERV
jgi:Na+(H+)/acetate symporter ActP